MAPLFELLSAAQSGANSVAKSIAQSLTLSLALGLLLLLAPLPAAADFSGVDYTLTNQNEQDFSGQDLANTSFAGAT